ncbi:L-ascorbate metabolism protein UlaG (beta-lactamase superfamily) [Marmoricola sp. OAE513]|uniref:MBL fold metallo-hydrolase n=1 Tax=Marmoricola sp. OAE513 TaxID=2817894 RepID=UPI001AE835D8
MSRPRLPILAAALGAAAVLVSPVANATRGLRRSMGADPEGDPRVTGSPQWQGGGFQNRLESHVLPSSGSQGSMAVDFAKKGDIGRPAKPVPLVTPALPEKASDFAATWLGHATVLLELNGHWVLTDPVWSDRVSPSATVGPKRSHPVPMELADLPALSAVLISHDHYDHLDTATIDWLTEYQSMPIVVPLGIGAHLRAWGVPEERIVELDWDESHTVVRPGLSDLVLTCTEARHFSGRGFTRNKTLWSSWVVASGTGEERRSVFFGGDTGYTPAFADIGDQHGPFDLTVLPIGAYDTRWSDIHMNPAEAVQTHLDVHGDLLLPIHWGTFDLAFHSWSAPVEWLVEDAATRDVVLALPRPGERFDRSTAPSAAWWREVAKESRAS